MALHQVLAALADNTRRNILQTLRRGKISSGDLAKALGMTPQALSYHLARLKQAGLIYETPAEKLHLLRAGPLRPGRGGAVDQRPERRRSP